MKQLGLFLALVVLSVPLAVDAQAKPKHKHKGHSAQSKGPGCPLPNEQFMCRNASTVYRVDACNVHGQVTGLYACSVTATCRMNPKRTRAKAWDYHFSGSMECCDFLYDTHEHFTQTIPKNFQSRYCR